MKRALVIGDVHATAESLDDCRRLREHIFSVCAQEKPDSVIFLGDQYDAHGIVNVEVQRFWLETFSEFSAFGPDVYALVGNHDRPGNSASVAHSMQVHGNVHVVDAPLEVGDVLLLPYYHDSADLVRAAQASSVRGTVICHATLDGATYDNGFYAKEAVSPDLLPQHSVLSGHIHTPLKFGKVFYPGSPRWQNLNDANISRAIGIAEFSSAGLVGWTPYSTGSVCRRIWSVTYTPEDHCEQQLAAVKPGDLVVANIQGPMAFCEEARRTLARPGLRCRVFPTDRQRSRLSEAEGIGAAFEKHVATYQPKYGTPKDTLRRLLQERLHV